MALKIHYDNMSRSSYLENRVKSEADRLLRVVKQPDRVNADIRIERIRNNQDKGGSLYRVSSQVKSPGKQNMYVEKQDGNLLRCLRKNINSLRRSLKSKREKREGRS